MSRLFDRSARLGRSAPGLAATVVASAAIVLAAPGEGLVELCDELASRHAFSGVLLVARGDEILAERAYGFADAEGAVPTEVDTRFLVASLTKPVVAFATLRLVDAGVLGLEDPASEHIPVLEATAAGGATIRQLLSHTSGLPHYEGWPGFLDSIEKARGEEELLDLLAHTELVAEPGTAFHYSGPGYLLLGLVLEHATAQPLPTVLAEQVLTPLGMDASALLEAADSPRTHATPLVREGGATRAARSRHPSTLRAAGGLVTTARDLYRFARAVQGGKLLSEQGRATLLQPVTRSYACGLIVYSSPFLGGRFARHKGNMDGVAAHFVFGLDGDLVCVGLSNATPMPVDDIDDRLMARIAR